MMLIILEIISIANKIQKNIIMIKIILYIGTVFILAKFVKKEEIILIIIA